MKIKSFIIFMNFIFVMPIFGMKTNKIEIVDCMSGQSLTEKFDPNVQQKIGIFGATPNFSRYQDFCQTIAKHYQYFFDKQAKKQSIKQIVSKDVSKNLSKLGEEQKALLRSLEKQQDNQQMIDIFLHYSIDKKTFTKNLQRLVDDAQEGNILIHLFLPTYFANCKGVKEQTIQDFLKRSAYFYQQMYNNLKPSSNVRIVLLIPAFSYFINYISAQNEQQPIENIKQVLTQEVFSKLNKKNVYGLINQNDDQNKDIIKALRSEKEEAYDIVPVSLVTVDNFGRKASNMFTPYLLKCDRDKTAIEKEVVSARLITATSHADIMKMINEKKNEQK